MTRRGRTFRVFVSSTFIVLPGDRCGWQPLPPRIEATVSERLTACLTPWERARPVFDEARPTMGQLSNDAQGRAG